MGLRKKILEIDGDELKITMLEMAQKLNVLKRTIERVAKNLREKNERYSNFWNDVLVVYQLERFMCVL